MINLIIDGQPVQGQPGMTILQAAKAAGIKIPTLCYLADLTPEGACRVCVVEVEGVRNLVASCVYPISDGMVVRTQTQAVREARRMIIGLLVANHPKDCLGCSRNMSCELQRLAAEYGYASLPYQGEMRRQVVDAATPFIIRDTAKCILCGRCVQACKDLQGCNNLEWTRRGFAAEIAPAFDVSLAQSDCVFCGACVSVCPTGALTEKTRQEAPCPERRVKTTCPFCGVGCNFDLNVTGNMVTGITSNPDSAVNGRLTCVKGRFGMDFINSPQRLTNPLVKRDGAFHEVSWDEALDLIAARLGSIKAAHGGDAIGIMSSARCTNEENYLMQKFARAVIGTNNIDHCART